MQKVNPRAIFFLVGLVIAYAIIFIASIRHEHKRNRFCKEFCNGTAITCSSLTIKCSDGRTARFKGIINL
jgi:hypothetical protein